MTAPASSEANKLYFRLPDGWNELSHDQRLAWAQAVADALVGPAEDPQARWSRDFRGTVLRLAASGVPFTSEDAIAITGLPPRSPGAVGAIINAMARQGLIKRQGIRTALRPTSHGRYISVWGSVDVTRNS